MGDACRDGGWKDGRMEEEGGMSEDGCMGGWVEECMRQGGEIEGALRIYMRGGMEGGRKEG